MPVHQSTSGRRSTGRWGLLLLLTSCPRAAAPCEPWVNWGLADLADAPGQRLEACDENHLRYRVIPGGTVPAFLRELGRRPYAGWALWRQQALVRAGAVAVTVWPRMAGDDMVIELRQAPELDVAAALAELKAP